MNSSRFVLILHYHPQPLYLQTLWCYICQTLVFLSLFADQCNTLFEWNVNVSCSLVCEVLVSLSADTVLLCQFLSFISHSPFVKILCYLCSNIHSQVSLICSSKKKFICLFVQFYPLHLPACCIILLRLSWVSCVCCCQKTLVWLQEVEEKLASVGPVGAVCDTIRYQIDLIQVSVVSNPI